MKNLILLIVLSFSAMAQEDSSETLPDNFPRIRVTANPLYNSEGFYLGKLLNVRRVRPVLSTFEGEMQIGLGTSPNPVRDRRCVQLYLQRSRGGNQQDVEALAREKCKLVNNPWRFSTTNGLLFESMADVKGKGQTALVYYKNYFFVPQHILTKTRTLALDVFPTKPNLKIEPVYRVRAWRKIHPEAGHITGRIVRASKEFPVRESYEVIIQESENADNFRAMSVNDGGMFRYITQAMLTGKLLRIEYIRYYRPHASFKSLVFNYRTQYRVIGIEIIER